MSVSAVVCLRRERERYRQTDRQTEQMEAHYTLCNMMFLIHTCLCWLWCVCAEVGCKIRLDLIKAISMAVLQDLKVKADSAFRDMNDWLGARFLKEMERSAVC